MLRRALLLFLIFEIIIEVRLLGKLMNSDNKTVDNNTNGIVKLQTDILQDTKNFLRLESVRRHVSMGMLIDELIRNYLLQVSVSVPEKTS